MRKIIFLMIFCTILSLLVGCQKEVVDNKNTKIANPASVYCNTYGGTLEIVTKEAGEMGICTLSDGTKCDEWAFFRGECGPEKHICTDKQKAADLCTMEYLPVCGDDGVTYGNGCSACASKKINSWIWGECLKDRESDCTCPEGYRKEGTACNPECYYDTPQCLMPSLQCKSKECDGCPNLMPPGPDFCKTGTIVAGEKDECGCQAPPKCV